MAFESVASNLVPGDTNGVRDIFVHDTQTGLTTRASLASDGNQGSSKSESPAISADGRYVAFWSEASNLVPGDTNGWSDVLVHDGQTGQTRRVSVASDGTQADGPSGLAVISADGRYVVFDSIATNLVTGGTSNAGNVFLRDNQTDQTILVYVSSAGAHANDGSGSPAISADGRYVAFASNATNLVPDDTNEAVDVFVRDRGSSALTLLYLPLVVQGASTEW